ncbi:adenylosuccinate lyase [Myxococcota bacterium]
MIERYETEAIKAIWNDDARFRRWTRVEVAACEAFCARGEIPKGEMQAIRHADHGSAAKVAEIEATTHHDVVAFVRAISESVGEPASRHLHRGLTSSDVVDTALALAMRESVDVTIAAAKDLREVIGRRAREHKITPCAGRTHGIHAEPTTFGLRLAGWYTEVGRHLQRLERVREEIGFGKLSGAVGNFSQTDPEFEAFVLERLDLAAEPVATQVVPRDRHAAALCALSLLGAGLERFATEVRALQRTDIREAEEPFRKGQTGSSAMPHKRNPILTERVSGMARLLRGYAMTGIENVALWHDRDISHSSVERVILPDAFHTAHYMLRTLTRVLDGLRVYPQQMLENLERTRGLVFSQNVLGVLLRQGLDRQGAYASVQRAAMRVWEGEAADFKSALREEDLIKKSVPAEVLESAFGMEAYTRHLDTLFARAGLGE